MISIVESPNLANVSCRLRPMMRKSPVSYEIGGDLPGEGCRFAGALVDAWAQHEDIQAASRRNLSSGTLDGTTVGQINRNEMTPPSGALRRQGLNEPRHAAAEHQDFGVGPGEVKGDGAPDVARGSGS